MYSTNDDLRAALAYLMTLCEEHVENPSPGFEHPAAVIRHRLESGGNRKWCNGCGDIVDSAHDCGHPYYE